MKAKTEGNIHILRLESGEEVVEGVANYCRSQNVTSGCVQAIGAVSEATLGFFDFAERDYIRKDFTGELEVVALNGNISIIDGEPFPHLHAILAGHIKGRSEDDFHAFGGHLFRGVVSATLEVYLTAIGEKIERKLLPDTGLRLLDL